MKKILSLALALILTLSAFVLPASAAVPSEETVEPCAQTCAVCRTGMMYNTDTILRYYSSSTVDSCPKADYAHSHYFYRKYYVWTCTNCSYTYETYSNSLIESCIND